MPKAVPGSTKPVVRRLAAKLKRVRYDRRHTIRQAAAELDCSIESVRNWERGWKLPIKEKLLRLAAYTGLSHTSITQIWIKDRKSVLRKSP